MPPALEGKVLRTGPPGKFLGKLLKASMDRMPQFPGPLPVPAPPMTPVTLLGMQKGLLAFPVGSAVKNLPANVEDTSSIPGSGRSSGEGNGNPLQYFCLGNPLDRGARQCRVRELEKARLGKTMRLALYKNR